MKPKTTLILIALLINLGLLLLTTPGRAGASSDRASIVWFPCCKTTTEGSRYCCQNCCFFRWDCLTDEHCAPRQ